MLIGTERVLRRVAALLVLGAGAVALASACGDESADQVAAGDAGGATGSLEPGTCPSPGQAPAEGAACRLPEGTTCDFGECGRRIAQCTRGAWRYGTNGSKTPPCPETVPNPDVSCPPCWPAAVTCRYGSTDCSLEDASVNTAVASCPSGRWVLDIRPCRDGGGPDVQGDAEPDGD